MRKVYQSKILGAILLLFLVFLAGIMVFTLVYGYTFIDALYMTVITITTVGFGNCTPCRLLKKFSPPF